MTTGILENMRGRKKEPEGRRVTVCAKFSEAEAALIDSERGDTARSAFVRDTVLSAFDMPEQSTEEAKRGD